MARLELDITHQLTPEDQEITCAIVEGRHHFEWAGQDDEAAVRPYEDLAAAKEFIEDMRRVARRLSVPVVLTKELEDFLEQSEQNEQEAKEQETSLSLDDRLCAAVNLMKDFTPAQVQEVLEQVGAVKYARGDHERGA